MWVKVDDKLPGHRKVFLAAGELGPHSSGRVLAVWLEAMCWVQAPENLSNGFIPTETVRTLRHDRHPLKVMQAMAKEHTVGGETVRGLWQAVPGGFVPTDYDEYSATPERRAAVKLARAEAGRRGGQKSGATRQAKAKQLASNVSSKNETSHKANEIAKSNPDPDPEPKDPPPLENPPLEAASRRHESAIVSAGELPRDHLDHAFCWFERSMCVPRRLHDELVRRVGGASLAAADSLRRFYADVVADYGMERPIVESDRYRFWNARYAEWQRAKPVAASAAARATAMADTERLLESLTAPGGVQ